MNDSKMKVDRFHISWRRNGFGLMFLWVVHLYIQIGPVKLIIYNWKD